VLFVPSGVENLHLPIVHARLAQHIFFGVLKISQGIGQTQLHFPWVGVYHEGVLERDAVLLAIFTLKDFLEITISIPLIFHQLSHLQVFVHF
jgi:hypothetical protein